MSMQAEVIAIGDELTSGQRLDTNSQWLSQRLGDLGVRVMYHTTVGDDLRANAEVFRQAFERADLILCTGGLGPTADDLTRQALAGATGTELVLHDDVLQHIRSLFARRGREMPEHNAIQACFPEGSRVLPNPHGSAPGIDMSVSHPTARVFAVPGVPAEMREMWSQTVQPTIEQMLGQQRRVIRHRRVKCFGVGESDLEQMLPDMIRRGRQPTVGITVSKATITLRITAEAVDEPGCSALIAPTVQTIQACLGELVFGEEDDELQDVVVRMLRQRGQTLATVEAGTGGLLSHWLSHVDEQAETFLGAAVVRGRRSLDAGAAGGGEAASDAPPQAAAVTEMALHGRERFATDYCLAVGEFPDATTQTGRVFFALAGPQGLVTDSARFAGHPDILKERSAKQALNLLRLRIGT